VQVPAVKSVAVVPATVQTPVLREVKLTISPEVADAVKGMDVPATCAGMVLNVTVCEAWLTVKGWETGVAAA
jgi:hypothetical protein